MRNKLWPFQNAMFSIMEEKIEKIETAHPEKGLYAKIDSNRL